MPALVGPLLAFLLGVGLAWLCREHDDERLLSPRTAIVALFAALVFAPVAAYFLIFSGDWAFFYLVDSRTVPSALELCLVLLDVGLVLAGFLAGRHATHRRAERTLMALGITPGLLIVGLLFAFFPRLRVEGTYHQVKSAFGTQPVAGGPLGYAIRWMNGLLIAGVVLTVRALGSQRRAPAPSEPSGPQTPQPLLGRRSRR
jgi:cytochrome bd-type quinol oxidase subunit 2